MPYAPTLTVKNLSRIGRSIQRRISSLLSIGFNTYVFKRYLSGIGRGVSHTPSKRPRSGRTPPPARYTLGRMLLRPTLTVENLSRIGWPIHL